MADSGGHSHSGGSGGEHPHGLFGPHSSTERHDHSIFNSDGKHGGALFEAPSGGHAHGLFGDRGSHDHGSGGGK